LKQSNEVIDIVLGIMKIAINKHRTIGLQNLVVDCFIDGFIVFSAPPESGWG